ncbi:MAG: hypothetical protein IKR25_12140 [Muribaculaceae bacterium]|nr:hypothetical protein [Muribaculaceae bacterium]
MRTVSPDEAKVSYENLKKWAASNSNPKGKGFDERVFQKTPDSVFTSKDSINHCLGESASLTPHAVQVAWTTPTEFPLCPQKQCEKPLDEYMKRLIPGQIFCHNQFQDSIVIDTAIDANGSALYVMCKFSDVKAVKPWSLAKVTYRNGVYYHEGGTYFEEIGARKYFTLAKGEEWTGGDVLDDFC